MDDPAITHVYVKKDGYYYRPNASGYTQYVHRAGVFPKEEYKNEILSQDLTVIPINTANHDKVIMDEIRSLRAKLLNDEMQRTITWRKPVFGEIPDGDLLVEVDKSNGESDVAIVFIDDDCQTLLEVEYQQVWTSWLWADVSRYVPMEEVLLPVRVNVAAK